MATATVTTPLSEFIGEPFTTRACFENTGDATGFQPIFELITPAGVTFNSATYLSGAVSASTAQPCSTLAGCTFTNPDTNTPVTVADGETFWVLRYPLGSFTVEQPPQCMDLNFSLGNPPTVQLGVPKNLTVTPVFSLGADALDNPATDLPIFGFTQTIVVNPTVIQHTKVITSPEDETATGPNYPRTVTLTVDVATVEIVDSVTVTDVLPPQFQYQSINLTQAPGCSVDPISTISTTSPGGTLTLNCGSITGVAGVDRTITFTFYIPELGANSTPVLDATTPDPVPIINNSSVDATYQGNSLPPTTASDTISAKAVALQKRGDIVTGTGPAGLTPGDTVEYTLTGQVSDYFTVGDLTVTDTLGDGQTYLTSFTPTIALQSNGTPVAATDFQASEFTVVGKDANGRTLITFDLSAAITQLISGSGGQLVGDNTGGLGQGPTTFTIRLRSTIDNGYSGPVRPGGTQTLSAGDTVANSSEVRFTVPGGSEITEGTNSSLTIAAPTLAKDRYALNENTNPSDFLIAAGDTVTYRLTTSLPVSSVENFTLTDYLPIPLFRVPTTLTNAGSCVGGVTPTPPAENAWCYTSADTVSSTPPTVTTTPALNRIVWSYGDRELPTAGGTIDILYTLRATAEPMADQLNLANLAIQSYQGSLSTEEQTAATTAQVTTRQPQLAIRKEITAVSRGTIAGTPTTGLDAEAQNLDAGDTVTYRVRITNTGSALAYGIRVTDDAGTLTAFSSCTVPAATLGGGAGVSTTGSLFTPDPAGLTITGSLAGSGAEIWITYTCTLAANATPRTTDIDNTAVLRNYTNIDPTNPPSGLTPTNFATNTNLLTRQARLTTQGIQSITKAITASSVPDSTPDNNINNINNGETLTFTITATLSEGTYTGFALTDNTTTIPSPTCSAPFSCSNVSASGGTVTVTDTTGSTAGTISYTYTTGPLSASGSNTASVSATNAPARTASTSWTLDDPDPAITKTLSPAGSVNAGDTVQIQLGWSNTDTNNPMFRCTVTDVLDGNVFDLTTVLGGTTPTGYTFAYDSGTRTVTYTATDLESPCPTVAAGGAVFSVSIRNDVVTGSYSNTATISAQTLPASQSGGASVTASATAPVPIGAPSVSGKTITGTSLADTTGSNVAIGEVVTYRLVFRMAEGVTNSIRLIDQLLTGTSTAQLVYIPGTAQLSRNSTSLSAANNPGGINAAAIDTPVAVTPTLSGSNLIIDLGNVTNGENPPSGSTAENYTLEVQFRVGNVAANTAGRNLQNRPQITYRPAGASADQAVNGSTVTARVVAPRVAVGKTVSPAAGAGGDTVTYTLTVRNSATGANAAPAYDYAFSDTLPDDMPPTGTPTANVGATGAVVSGLGFGGQILSGTIDKLDPGETVTITYQAQLSATVPFGKMLVNSANANATSLPGSDANERTGSGIGPNNLFAGANATVTTQTVTMTKAIRNPEPFYAIGEEVEYELRLALPVGSATGMVVEDILPTGLSYVPGSAAITIVGGVTVPTAGSITPTSTSPLRFTLGTVSASSAGEVVIAYRARVDNVIANQDGESRTNNARVIYDNPNPSGVTPLIYTVPNPPTARIGEPNLEMTKTILAGATEAQAGSVVRWQFTVSNIGNTTARRVAINDVLPGNTAAEDKLTVPASPDISVTTDGGVSKETGDAVTASDFSVSNTNRARDTLSATGLVLEPGATLTVAFDTVIGANAAAGESLDNRVTAEYNSLPSGVSGGRDGSGDPAVDDDDDSVLNNYRESASHALQILSRVTIDKQVTPVRAAIGEIVTYQLRIDVIQGTTNSVVVTDELPAGLEYTGHAISVGNIGMAFSNPNYNTNLGSGQTVSFNLGNILNPANGSSDDDYVLVEIFGRVRNIATNQNGSIIANGEDVGSPVSVTYDGPTGPVRVDFDHDASTPGNQGIPFTVVEPVLGVTKTVNPAAQALGDIVTYTLNVSHQASSTADAYDVVLVDTIPVGLTYIADSVNPPPAFVSFDPGMRRLSLGYASLPLAEGARTITYQARVDVSATVGAPLSNSVAMTWTSQSGATGASDNGRTGADGPGGLNDYATTASTPVTPTASAAIYAPKTVVDLNGGVADPNDTLEYTIVLTNTGSSTVNNVVFTDPIPANTTYVAASLTLNGVAATNTGTATQVQLNLGSLLSGASATIRFSVTINAGVASGVVIRNQGSVDSDETVPKPTDGDGNPNNGDQPTDIPVGGQPPLTGALYAEKTVAWTDTNRSGTVNAGDALRYTIVLRNRGATTLTGLSFSDTIPTGLTYVPPTVTASSGAATITGQNVAWTGIADLAPGASQTLRFGVTITSVTDPSQTFVNQGAATSTQTGSVLTDSNGDPSDGAQPTSITAVGTGGTANPALDVQKRWSLAVDNLNVGVVDPGDTVQYTITVANTGAQAATDVRLTDAPLPAQFTYVPGSLATSLGAVVTETPIAVNIGTLNPGQTATVTFRMTVNPDTEGQIASNQANATANGGISVDSDDNGNAADGRNPTLTPIGPVAPSGLSKSLVNTSVGDDTSNLVQIGEILTYQVQFNVPAGATGEVTMLDTLPAGMSYVANSARLARVFATGLTASQNPGGINGAASNSFVNLTDDAEAALSGSTVSVFLGNVINSSNPATTESYILELQARVENVAGNQAGTALNNEAGLSYRNAAGQLFNLSPVTQTATVAEPNLQIVKTADVNAVLANTASTIRFTLTLTNPTGASVSTGYDVSASDPLPAGFASASLVGAVSTSGDVTGASCSFTGTTLNCNAAVFPPGGQVVVTYDAVTTATLVEGSSLVNSAAAQWTSLPGADPDERTGAGDVDVNDYADASGVTIRVGTPALDKSIVDPQTRYAIGDEVTYRVVLSFPGTLTNVSFQDVLPEGLTYVGNSLTLNYGVGLSSSDNPTAFTRVDNSPAAGQETLSLALGTMTNGSGAVRTLTLTYRALVDNILGNQDGQTLPNAADLTYDQPGVGTPATVSDTETITVGEPRLAVTHTITSPTTNLDAGDAVTYRVTVTNTGNTPSFETTLRDLLPPGLGNVQGISVVLTNTSGNSETPTITVLPDGWQSSPFVLQPGDVVTIVFTATLQNTVQPGQTLQARVDATYSSRDGDDPNQRDGSTPGSNQDDDTALNNYNVEELSPIITVGDSVALNKAFHPDPARTAYSVGETVTYRLTVALSQGSINGVTVTDILPAGLTYLDATVGAGNTGITTGYGGAPAQSGQTLTFALGNVVNPANGNASDDFLTIDIRARVDNVAANQTGTRLGNAVELRFIDGAGIPQTRDFDADAGTPGNQPLELTVVEPNLALDKAATPAQPSLGDEVTFRLILDHTAASTADAFDLVATDNLPAGLSYVAGSASLALSSISPDGRTLTWTIASLTRATDNLTITYRARVSPGAVVGLGLTNTAALRYASTTGATGAAGSGRTGAGGPGGALNDYAATDAATVAPTAAAVIGATKTVRDLNGGVALPGDVLEYSITLTNTSGEAVSNVVFTDPIPANTEYVAGSATLNGSPAGSFSDDTLTVNVGTLNPGASATIAFRVRINPGTPSGIIIYNQGVVDSDQTVPTPTDADGDPGNGAQPTTTPIGGQPPLTGALYAEKTVAWTDTDNSVTINAGDTLRYTIALRNRGVTTLTGLSFSDTIPTGLTYVPLTVTASSGAATITGQNVAWTGIADLAPGASQTLRFDVTIGAIAGASQTFVNQGAATSTQTGSVLTDSNGDPSDGTQPTVITATTGGGAPRLDLQKRWTLVVDAGRDGTVNPGDTLLYTLLVSNSGSAPANDVRIEDAPPAQVTLIPGSVLASRGAVVSENPIVVNLGNLNPGELATIRFRVTVNAGTGGQSASNQASATAANVAASILSDDNGDTADGRQPTATPILDRQVSPVATIPTLSEWGIIILSLLMVVIVGAMRQRRGIHRF